jgi:hypothetical protein
MIQEVRDGLSRRVTTSLRSGCVDCCVSFIQFWESHVTSNILANIELSFLAFASGPLRIFHSVIGASCRF